jgi:hypothetical protein
MKQFIYMNMLDKKLNYIWNLNEFSIIENIHEYIINNDYINRIKQKIHSHMFYKLIGKMILLVSYE